jgi:uncharacterized protein (DUF1330 family)
MTDAGAAGQAAPAPYYVVFDVDVRDAPRYGEYMAHVLPQIEAAGGKYLARGGPHTVYEGDWSPYRLVLLEFPSREAFEGFYHSPAYQDLHALRDEVSYARMVGVEGLPSPDAAAAATLAGRPELCALACVNISSTREPAGRNACPSPLRRSFEIRKPARRSKR